MPRHTPVFYTPLQKGGTVFRRPATTTRPRSRKSLMRWMATLALLGLLVVGIQNAYPSLVHSELFLMEKIDVDGNRLLPEEEVVAWSALSVGGNLFACDLASATERLQAQPIIEQVLLRREPPETLVISLKEREPVALVKTSGGLQGVCRNGMLFPLPQVSLDLPVMTGLQADSDGVLVELQKLARFAHDLKVADAAFWRDVSEIQVRSPGVATVYLVGDQLEVRMMFGHVDRQVQNFRAYMQAATQRCLGLAYLDLRYQDQVVVGKREPVEAQLASIEKH